MFLARFFSRCTPTERQDQRDARAARESHAANARLHGEEAWTARVTQACVELGCDAELYARWKHPLDRSVQALAQSELNFVLAAQRQATQRAERTVCARVAARLHGMAAAQVPTPIGTEEWLWAEEAARYERQVAARLDEAAQAETKVQRRRLARMFQSPDAAVRLAAAREVTRQERREVLSLDGLDE